jgi:hypothetical protein
MRALASAIHTKVKSSLIMRLSCGNTLKSPQEPAPFGCGPHQAFPQVSGVHSQDRDESRLVRITESLGNQGTLDEYFAQLGRDHRKYGVRVAADNLARAFREVLRRPATFRLMSRPGHQTWSAVPPRRAHLPA